MRQRRQRTNFNDETIDALDIYFAKNPYPDINERESIAKELHTSEDRIQVWFQNKRARYRKKMVKVEYSNASTNDSISLTPVIKKTNVIKKSISKNKANQSTESNASPITNNYSFCSQSTPEFQCHSAQHSNGSAYSLNDSCYGSFNQSYNYDISRSGLQNFNLNTMPYSSMVYSSPFAYNNPYFQLNSPYYNPVSNYIQASPIVQSNLFKADIEVGKERVTKPFFRPYE